MGGKGGGELAVLALNNTKIKIAPSVDKGRILIRI